MSIVTINWIEKTERAASFNIPDGFEASDVIEFLYEGGVTEHEPAFQQTNAAGNEFFEELASPKLHAEHDLTDELISWKKGRDEEFTNLQLAQAFEAVGQAINGYLEDCIAGSEHHAEQRLLTAAWKTIVSMQAFTTVNEAWHLLKERAGTIGVLYDPEELANLLDFVDPDNPTDMDALTAWCDAQSDSLQDSMSEVMYANLPGRADIDAALAKRNHG